jgi:hypothetical protein
MPTQSRFFQNIVVRLFRLINDIIASLDQVPEFFHTIMRFISQMKTDFTSLGVRLKFRAAFVMQSQSTGTFIFIDDLPFADKRIGNFQ